VHDQFGQIVTATKMMVIEMSRNHPEVPPETVGQITSLLDEAISVTRRISSELRPPLLDDLGLFAAMQVYARNLSLRSKVEAMVDVDDDELLSASQANQLFRIFQEATTNILRHAQATRIWVRGAARQGNFELEIADDGQGPQAVREGATGLRNMRERASLAGGSFQFGPGPRCGTMVRVMIPLRASPAASDFVLQEFP
jgi:signal transduction histidine kinase